MGQTGGPSLADVFHEVPCLWEFMDTDCYKGLLGTCVCLRQGGSQFVTMVRLPAKWKQEDISVPYQLQLAKIASSGLEHKLHN